MKICCVKFVLIACDVVLLLIRGFVPVRVAESLATPSGKSVYRSGPIWSIIDLKIFTPAQTYWKVNIQCD